MNLRKIADKAIEIFLYILIAAIGIAFWVCILIITGDIK
jgi:hypothetical protein